MNKVFRIAPLLMLAGCATVAAPPSATQVTFPRAHIEKVVGAFAAACAADGARIVSQTPNMLECAKPMGTSARELLYRAAATERNSSNPDFHMQWTFFASADGIDVTVNASDWMERQNAFGKTERDAINGGDASQILGAIRDARAKRLSADN